MRILLFTEVLDCGGIDTFIVNLVNNWPEKDDSFVIVANSSYPGLRLIEEKLTRPCEVIRHKVLLYVDVIRTSSLHSRLKKAVNLFLRYVFICGNVLAFRKLLLETNSDFLLVVNGGYPGGDSCRAAGISWGLFSGKPRSIHNFHNIVMRAPLHLRLQEFVVDTLLSLFTDRFVTVSRAAAESMALRPLIHRQNKTGYIHNGLGIMPSAAAPRKNIRDEIGIPSTAPLCLMLGTYEKRKGHYFLFRAFREVLAEIPDAHLLVCGFGFPQEIEEVKRHAKDLRLENAVHLQEFRTDLSDLLSNADLLLVASQEYESFGYTSIEAMSQRIPVVATSVGGVPEVVLDDDGGYCFPPGDIQGYAGKIVELLLDDKLRAEQGRKGYERVQRLFTAEIMAGKYRKLIREHAARRLPVMDE